jgi:hypothetical protein
LQTKGHGYIREQRKLCRKLSLGVPRCNIKTEKYMVTEISTSFVFSWNGKIRKEAIHVTGHGGP